MNPLRRQLCSAALLAVPLGMATSGMAAPAVPKDGSEYLTLPAPQPTSAGDKVEVIEFFAYSCPHCNVFEPLLAAWVKEQGANVVFRRVHVGGSPRIAAQQRLFFTLESMGLLEQYHTKVFAAMHKEGQRLATDEQVIEWAARAGIDRAKFSDTYRAFGLPAKMRRADAMMDAYRVDSWPMVAIDGRFLTSPSLANQQSRQALTENEQQQNALQVMDQLVARAKAERK
jgi:thiol:disulfide interchange protein DsbA